MSNLEDLIAHAQAHPETRDALLALVDAYLDETVTAQQRAAIRAAAADPRLRQAYENLYYDGVGMEQPVCFVRRMIAALFMTGGLSDPETGRQIVAELRLFADHHGIDFDSHRDSIRALPGARPPRPRRLRFALANAVLFGTLVLGTAALQAMPGTLRLVLQIVLLLAVAGGQMALLYWYFRG
jgi:hypothetical protein